MLMLECQSHSLQFVVSSGFVQSLKKRESLGKMRCLFSVPRFGKKDILAKVLESLEGL